MEVSIQGYPKQRQFYRALLDAVTETVVYVGGRAGGKSHSVRVGLLLRALLFPGSEHILFRRTRADVVAQHMQPIRAILREWGMKEGIDWSYNKVDAAFYLHTVNSVLRLAFADSKKSCEKYMGPEYLTIAFDECQQFEEETMDLLFGSARVAVAGAPTVKRVLVGNPGGVGDRAIKKRYLDPLTREPTSLYIKALVHDNLILMRRDPDYPRRLAANLPEWKRKQWLDGDWDAQEGSYFNTAPGTFVFVQPPSWAKWIGSVDWGYSPCAYACIWVAYWRDGEGNHRMHVYADLKRHKLTEPKQARETLAVAEGLPAPVTRYIGCWSISKRQASESDEATRTTQRAWLANGLNVQPAKRRDRVPGWMLLRQFLDPCYRLNEPETCHGILTISPNCMSLRAELADAMHHENDEDLDGDDDVLDCVRQLLTTIYQNRLPENPKSAYERMIVPRLQRKGA